MKIKEFIAITDEGEYIRIRGQFSIPNRMRKKKKFKIFEGIAMNHAKPGEVVMVRI